MRLVEVEHHMYLKYIHGPSVKTFQRFRLELYQLRAMGLPENFQLLLSNHKRPLRAGS